MPLVQLEAALSRLLTRPLLPPPLLLTLLLLPLPPLVTLLSLLLVLMLALA